MTLHNSGGGSKAMSGNCWQAGNLAGLPRLVYPPLLWHAFATHLLEADVEPLPVATPVHYCHDARARASDCAEVDAYIQAIQIGGVMAISSPVACRCYGCISVDTPRSIIA